MAHISLKDVSVLFPIHTDLTRSLRHSVLAPKVGAFFRSVQAQRLVCVEALSDLNFDLVAGDRLGLIGHNGSGKSTLLRVLSGVYVPTSGRANIEGSSLSLFDLGQGVQSDSSGVENIYALALLMGKSRQDVHDRLDAIVEFTELGDYVNMPVRTYSAGMMVRLSFAVATEWQSDILLLDEVMGAGDASFFEKAHQRLVKLMDASSIVVMANHNHETLRRLCNKGMVMGHGKCLFQGSIDEAIAFHTELMKAS